MSYAVRRSKKARSTTETTSRRRRPKRGSPRSNASADSGSGISPLNEDWSEFLAALISTGTRFLLIGGHAVAVHAEPRFTEDLDVFVAPSESNAARLRRALVDFGFGSVAPPVRKLALPNRVWMLGRKPRRIDILTGISGVSFAEASRGKLVVSVGGIAVPVIGRRALLKNKVASGRTKDRLDVELLAKHAPRRRRS